MVLAERTLPVSSASSGRRTYSRRIGTSSKQPRRQLCLGWVANRLCIGKNGEGLVAARGRRGKAIPAGRSAWGRVGVAVSQMREIPVTLYTGEIFDKNVAVVCPKDASILPAIWCSGSSPAYNQAVRRIDQKLNVTNATLVKVPFDVDRWTKVAAERYPNGLPKPYSNDPTQWIFHGHPCGSVNWDEEKKWTTHDPLRTDTTVLQIDASRLLGYRRPSEHDPEMDLAEEQRTWVENSKALHPFADDDGIVRIPSVRSERPAAERVLQLPLPAYGDDWHDETLTKLLTDSDSVSLDDWLRNLFFEERCKLFNHRPFVWYIWNGRKLDGFHALVNYHKLAERGGKGRRLLESRTYSCLGDWISRQQGGVKRGEGGAENRLVAALGLQKRLVAILEGEPPFDLFVRWKPIEEQSIWLGAGHQRRCPIQYPSIHAPGSTRRQERRGHSARQTEHSLEERPRQGTDTGPRAVPLVLEERQVHRRAGQRCAFDDCRQTRCSHGEKGKHR